MLSALLSHFAACTSSTFFGLPTWYKYLVAAGKMQDDPDTGRCEFISMNGTGGFQVQDLSLVGLALVDIALRVAALVAVGYVIYGGMQFVLAQGDTERTKRARQTVINSLIGLIIALISTGLVAFIGRRIG